MLFENVLSPLAQLPNGWRHVGYVCFPRIQSKDEIPKDKISEKDFQVKFKQCDLPRYRVIKRIGPDISNVYCTSIFHNIIIN